MRLLQPIFLFTFLLASAVSATTHVAVLETISEKGVIGRSEKMFLTDELRKRANVILPEYMGFVVMTRENINAMLPPGKTMEDCEGTCLVETGKNISADYVAQARVGKFGKQLTLTMELYETAENKLVGSFTARKPDAEGLLEEIEREADAIFQKILGTGVAPIGDSEGISGISTGGNGYRASGVKNHIVRVESSPAGAMFSTDGRVNANCNKTPCDITLPAGKHLFRFSMDMYLDKNESVDIEKNGQKISTKLTPNFGELILAPIFEGNMGSINEAEIMIDGKKVQGEVQKLFIGSHKIQISHPCYETISFNANIKKESKIRFDKKISPLLGGLEMNASFDGKPKIMPVFVNDHKTGETPFLETIPICAKVQVGYAKEDVPVKLKKGTTVKFTYNGSSSKLLDKRDGKKYRIIQIGDQVWMAENLNHHTTNSFCYLNNETNCSRYGRLYNWDDAKIACPQGWHLPTNREFETMIDFVGGKPIAGKKLKTEYGWIRNGNGSDDYSFSVIPVGYKLSNGNYLYEGEYARFWNSTEYGSNYAYAESLCFDSKNIRIDSYYKDFAFSVRCVKDD